MSGRGPEEIVVLGAREHNLKGVDLRIPRDSLVVFTGLSGSGKSSLAFDTVYQEGQRRFMESLSAYARQFLGKMEKPKVDHVEGLSPTISIDQKTVNRNPRSTVGTVTELLDYLRLLMSRLGVAHCPVCDTAITALSPGQIAERMLGQKPGARLTVLAPIVRDRKGEYRKELDDLRRQGWLRVRIDGTIYRLDEELPALARYEKHTLEIVLDRARAVPEDRPRVSEAVERSLALCGGVVSALIEAEGEAETHATWSSSRACAKHPDISIPELEPRLFSFNAPQGACPTCGGLGELVDFDPDRLVNPALPLKDAFLVFNEEGRVPFSWVGQDVILALAAHLGAPVDKPWREQTEAVKRAILLGEGVSFEYAYTLERGARQDQRTRTWAGLLDNIKHVYHFTKFPSFERFRRHRPCLDCHGKRLNPVALAVRFRGYNIAELSGLTIREGLQLFDGMRLNGAERQIGQEVLREIAARLKFLDEVGLSYLSLSRSSATLSGGEAQRIRLAAQVGSGLQGVTYVLDEPSIGLHPRDNQRLLRSLLRLRDVGNSVLVVEHDRETMEAADWVVDVGPGAGVEGGALIHSGPPETLLTAQGHTAAFLRGDERIPLPEARRPGNGQKLTVVNARANNLQSVTVSIPLGAFVAVTGVSGSGKSSLVVQVLERALARLVNGAETPDPGPHDRIDGVEHLDKIIVIDQSPIGRTPRSNPATYTSAFDEIRSLFTALPESKARGWKPGRFSFNVPGGRCEECEGAGVKTIEMQFLADVQVECEACGGRRFNTETLEVRYRGHNIADVLAMPLSEAAEFFQHHRRLKRILDTLVSVGLGYVSLGQPSTTLSGGEAQRVKLATELHRPATGRTLYILDEPTTGLHFVDVRRLLDALQRLVDVGNSVLVIEHDLDVVKVADHVLDLGPEGGDGGGLIVGEGTPEHIATLDTPTGRALATLPEFGAAPRAFKPHRAARRDRPPDLQVRGATCHNLKSVNLTVPKDSLTVITGVSGSGKTSLAFDTLFAEGQRRYVECMSTYARRFLGRLDRAPVESVEGLAPAIAINQKTASHNPRSTVATVTEIYDYLRLFWARAGEAHCPHCDAPIVGYAPSAAARHLQALAPGPGWLIAPLPKVDDGEARRKELLQDGYLRLFGPQGEVSMEDAAAAKALLESEPYLVADRLNPTTTERQRVAEAVKVAYAYGGGKAAFQSREGDLIPLSEEPACPVHGKIWAGEITPRHFSFNSYLGACRTCDGVGVTVSLDPTLLFPDTSAGVLKALDPRVASVIARSAKLASHLSALLAALKLKADTPLHKYSAEQLQALLYGLPGVPLLMQWTSSWGRAKNIVTEEGDWPGLVPIVESWSSGMEWLRRARPCPSCEGGRLQPEVLAVRVSGLNIHQATILTVEAALEFFQSLTLDETQTAIAAQPLDEVRGRLRFLRDVGLGYISLDRGAATLSGGEAQRIRLASQLGSGLTGCIYVLDEPTVGLHPRDTQRLLGTLVGLRDLGNTVIVVEHDPETMATADFIVDMGPGAGDLGGEIVASGTLAELLEHPRSLTGAYLSGRRKMPRQAARRPVKSMISLINPRVNNLKVKTLRVPVGVLTVVTGVSGSGKSSLIMDALVPALSHAMRITEGAGPAEAVELPTGFKKLVVVDQSPIGTTPRSTPATTTKLMDSLRDLYAQAPIAKERGWDKGRFSFNNADGRCAHCEGRGSILVEMHFLSDVWVVCEHCKGRRFNDATLEARWAGLSIADALDLRVDEALEVFGKHRALAGPLRQLQDVGLGYIRLGQPATTMSGGEAQRVKLAKELGSRGASAIYVLDEPTTGLHFADVDKLIGVLQRLVDNGATVIVIEHNLDVILNADHVIDMGPEGGDAGGELLFEGTPEGLAQQDSPTGRALAALIPQVSQAAQSPKPGKTATASKPPSRSAKAISSAPSPSRSTKVA
ncbi:MAG: excinuclease ABC subunit UvrA [Deltaproteobacteria bacterium]|nr:excinuclease ABC subunit UvrA [Deltaproteobacteria bacterium]